MMKTQARVAILTENGVEQIELTSPREALKNAGFKVDVISPQQGKVKGWNHTKWGDDLTVDKNLKDASPAEYDLLLLPGGVMNPDKLRMNKDAVEFVKAFMEQKKPVAAICHGPQVLIETGMLKGRKMTSYPSLKTDLENAGASWTDEPGVHDGNLITSRKPDDLPVFNNAIIEKLGVQD